MEDSYAKYVILLKYRDYYHHYYKIPILSVLFNVRLHFILTYDPRCEKTGLLGFCPGPTQTRLYKHTRWLEA